MAKFSVGAGRDDDGEGPSVQRPKRQRVPSIEPDHGGPSSPYNGLSSPLDYEPYVVSEDDQEIDDVEEIEAEAENDESEEDEAWDNNRNNNLNEGDRDDEADDELPVVVGPSKSVSLPVTLTDPDVLDCSICYEPLTIPVFQCDNGHTACSPCCRRLQQKCPSCSLPIGYNRCRAIEKVLESVRGPCQNMKYGCTESVTYSKKHEHNQTCIYSACSCPVLGCNYKGSFRQIYQHARKIHPASLIRFTFDAEFPIFFTSTHKLLILQEEKEGVLFLLRNEVEVLGNIITVSRLGPSSSKEGHYYNLSAKMEGCNLRLQSFTKNVKSRTDNPSGSFLLVPGEFFGSFGQISLSLSIWRDGKCPADIQRSSTAA